MYSSIYTAGTVLALLGLASSASITKRNPEVINRDFVVIGGGSSGTYSAIRLRDLNYSVVVVEKKQELGVG
jgi:heterodisulfide reductase subunit A-like polyferredoxin